jgi:hypothetical protein
MSALIIPSTNLVTAMMTTGSMKSLLDNCRFNIYSGTVPASADAANAGNTLLAVICLTNATAAYNCVWDTPAVAGVLSKPAAATWQTPTTGGAVATGVASFWRANLTGDDNSLAASGTNYRLQGSIGTNISFAMILASTSINSGDSIQFPSIFQIRLPTGA